MKNETNTKNVARDAGQTDAAPFQYFTATLRVIVKAEGCWDTEAQAQEALDLAAEKKLLEFCDGRGLDPDMDESDKWDEFCGVHSDYQRTSTSFYCIPSLNERLAHDQAQEVQPGQLPMLK
jgi:hypothetical protein